MPNTFTWALDHPYSNITVTKARISVSHSTRLLHIRACSSAIQV